MSNMFFNRLLDHIDPHRPARDPQIQQAQVLCGRWLALHRIHQGITMDEVAHRAQVPRQHVLFLETGLADKDLFTPTQIAALLDALALPASEHDYARAIVAYAVANATPTPEVVERIQTDIDQFVESHP